MSVSVSVESVSSLGWRAEKRSTSRLFDFTKRSVDATFELFLQLLKEFRCAHPGMMDLLLEDSDTACEKETKWRSQTQPASWSSNALTTHIAEWKAARLRWDSVQASTAVRNSPDFQAFLGWSVHSQHHPRNQ